MIEIRNLDSPVNIAFTHSEVNEIIAELGRFSFITPKVPVYTVSKYTIDKLYPPQKKITIAEECLKELRTFERKLMEIFTEEETDIFIREVDRFMERCFVKRRNGFSVVGLYLSEIPKEIARELDIEQKPSVFICCERCKEWGERKGIPAKIVFKKVLFHEFAHADMDVGKNTNYYNTWWGKVIEESLANAIALTRFKDKEEVGLAISLILDQPVEYKGGLVVYDKVSGWFVHNNYIYHLILEEIPFLPKIRRFLLRYIVSLEGLLQIWETWKEFPNNEWIETLLRLIALEILKKIKT